MQKPPCLLILVLVLVLPSFVFSQATSKHWEQIETQELQSKQNSKNRILPLRYGSFKLTDSRGLKDQLSEAPLRFSQSANTSTSFITIPMPDGSFEEFKIFESPVLSPILASKFPSIKTYSAAGITNPNAVAKIDFTSKGFHAMISAIGKNPVFVDPYNLEEQFYISYYKKDYLRENESFRCGVNSNTDPIYNPDEIVTRNAGDCQLREYQLALACTGEYAEYHDDGDATNGDAAVDAMAAMTTSLNRVNGVFERDAGITMVMVDDNDLIIFTNPNTDPYTNGSGGAMLGQNQTTCDNEIGSANYDIGHVYSTGGGGVAYLGSPCNNSIKAGGVTGQGSPEGDPFDIDYVAHEMGHQFGGNHTQNNSCNRANSASYEPGSASTIMGYAGICSPNVQSNSDDYYHAISLQEFGNFTTGSGNSCASIINSTNTAPTADAGSNYTIPISTPFVLTGVGTDSDDDPITYCWEQWDRQVATMPPVSTSTTGPAFRTFDPTTNPERYFPRLSVVAGSGTDDWEVLPSVNRALNFRLTVRDNNSAYGCTEEDNMTVTSSTTSGPFLVTYPNATLDWEANSTEVLTWDVANTTASPVSCANVDIFYSTDGGLSFPNTLATNVSNDGSHSIVVPDISSSLVRIMIKCSDNIFFDISDENVSIGVETICVEFTSTDVPVSISSSGTPTITSDLSVVLGETITAVNVLNLEGTHTYLGDLRFTLSDPAGTEVILINRKCGSDNDFDVNFNDGANPHNCPYNDNQDASPDENLGSFIGASSDGTWVLEIADLANADGGQLDSWTVEICYEQPLNPLPLDFLTFEANPKQNAIQLDWITANEIDNSGFEIQRSTNPQAGFDRIDWVDGLGNSEAESYTYLDQSVRPGIIYYYRLKQLDENAQYSFSDIRQAKITAEDLLVFIAPNPSRNDFQISISKEGSHNGKAELVDLLGRTLKTISFEMDDQKEITIEANELPLGVYFINLVLDNSELISKKVIRH